jgi:NAD(P)-dependent dehydrogenase (short-subunit alcohol dehydrogenase family)
MDLQGKRILITGASRGLGRTLAFAFAESGAREVVAGTRNQPDRDNLKLEAAKRNLNITPVQLDVTVDDEIAAVAKTGTFDVLINNAGVAGFGNPVYMDFEVLQRELDVNYVGALRMVRAVVPGMIEQSEGMIVNVATAFAKVNLPLIGSYCATKAALLSLGQALRAHLSEHGVKVITVMPTTIDTDMSRGAEVPKMTKEYVANEILDAILTEKIDPPIGDEATGILQQLKDDPVGLETMLSKVK